MRHQSNRREQIRRGNAALTQIVAQHESRDVIAAIHDRISHAEI
jgi:hypothetical protein